MKKRTTILALLSIAAGLTLGACGPKQDSKPASTGGDSSVPASDSGSTDVVPARIKISQPGIVLVGDVLKVSEIVTFTPEGANKYTVTSKNTEIATVTDNETITIVGPGATTIDITCPKPDGGEKKLGSINIKALSEEGAELQRFADSLKNNYSIIGTWGSVSGKGWSEVTESDTFKSDFLAMVCTPKYVLDWVYGKYSAIALDKADGDTYGYELVDAGGNYLPADDATDAEAELAKAAGIEVGDRVSSAYLNDYFVISNLLDVTKMVENTRDDGTVYFTPADVADAVAFVGSLFGMITDSFTGVGLELWMQDGAMRAEVRFDDSDPSLSASLVELTVKAGDDAKIAALETAVAEAEPPAKIDVSELAEHFAQFQNNFAIEWETGIFSRDGKFTSLVNYGMNAGGTTLFNGDTAVWAYDDILADGSYKLENPTIGGYKVNSTEGGVYAISPDEQTGAFVAADDPLPDSTSITSLSDIFYSGADVTSTVLDGASLTIAGQSEGVTIYQYTATFDSFALGTIIEAFPMLGYSFKKDIENNAPYIDTYIFDYGTAIQIILAMRVYADQAHTTTVYQGYKVTLFGAGSVPTLLGAESKQLFPDFYPAADEGGEGGEGGESGQGGE